MDPSAPPQEYPAKPTPAPAQVYPAIPPPAPAQAYPAIPPLDPAQAYPAIPPLDPAQAYPAKLPPDPAQANPAIPPPAPSQEYPAKPTPMGGQPPPPVYYPVTPVVFGERRMTVVCPYCQRTISTEVDRTYGGGTHLCCLFLFCTLGLSLFSCLPYFFCDADHVDHFCPDCKAKLGTWRPH